MHQTRPPLPASPKAQVPVLPEHGAAPAAAAPVILVVEDEALVAMMLEDSLLAAGLRCLVAHHGRAALDFARTADRIDAAVIDLHLGDSVDGRAVIRHLRARWPSLPVLVVTGFTGNASQADLRGLGGPTIRLPKVCAIPELLLCLDEVMAQPEDPAGRCFPERRGHPAADTAPAAGAA
jgi:DNA-binding response OmpR family regulator